MSKAYEFLKECPCFYVLTMNGDFPAGRPFGAVMENGDCLYIATNPRNQAHKQLRENGNIQILAKKDGTREWMRLSGKAKETLNPDLKQKMLDDCPVLSKHYASKDDPGYLVFEIEVLDVEFH